MTYHFHITLSHVHNPDVWRRVAVPSQFTFLRFHSVIQKAFGWWDDHLFQFGEVGKHPRNSRNIGIPDEEDSYPIEDARKVKLQDVIPRLNKLRYEYDFGDSWEHIIVLEKTEDAPLKRASLLAGEGVCPPEDCGGPPGYERMKLILSNPDHEEYYDLRAWLGIKKNAQWDAGAFDLKKAAGQVAKI